MVNERDAVITGLVLLVSGFLAVSFAGINLPGSSSTTPQNFLCNFPGLQNTIGSSDYCSEISEDSRYTLTNTIIVDRLNINGQSFDYKTSESTGGLLANDGNFTDLALPAETRNARINWILRDNNGRIVATETDRFGTIVGTEQKSATFKVGNVPSGTYTVEINFYGEGCDILGICFQATDSFEREIEVPKLPLGEY